MVGFTNDSNEKARLYKIMEIKQKELSVKINPNEIPNADYDVGCSVLASSVKRCFEQPGTKEEYEEWLKSEENSATVLLRYKERSVRFMSMYWTCPYCHSNLDPGERCDCQKEKQIKNIHRNTVFTLLPHTKQIKKLKLRAGGA